VIAEGVETVEHGETLLQLGCARARLRHRAPDAGIINNGKPQARTWNPFIGTHATTRMAAR
jgi:hypothetical protein